MYLVSIDRWMGNDPVDWIKCYIMLLIPKGLLGLEENEKTLLMWKDDKRTEFRKNMVIDITFEFMKI